MTRLQTSKPYLVQPHYEQPRVNLDAPRTADSPGPLILPVGRGGGLDLSSAAPVPAPLEPRWTRGLTVASLERMVARAKRGRRR
jgi:hypothetical protein